MVNVDISALAQFHQFNSRTEARSASPSLPPHNQRHFDTRVQPQDFVHDPNSQRMLQCGSFLNCSNGAHSNLSSVMSPQNLEISNWTTNENLQEAATAQRPVPFGRNSRQRSANISTQAISAFGIHPIRLQPDLLPHQSSLGLGGWNQKGCPEMDFNSLDQDIPELGQGLMSTDEHTPIIDIRQLGKLDPEHGPDGCMSNAASRRMSESSFSISSNGPIAEVPNFEEMPPAEVPFSSDCDWDGLESTVRGNSPTASPRPPHHDHLRPGSRSRVSPVSHNNMRTSPYSIESIRGKRWSTGMYSSSPMAARPMHLLGRYSSLYGSSPLNPHNGLNSFMNDPTTTTFAAPNQPLLYSQHVPRYPGSNSANGLWVSTDGMFSEPARQLSSQSLFRFLPSHSDHVHGCASQYGDVSDPPDLYSSLHQEPSNPPESDMDPSDPDLVPHEQDLRFPGDLYTPRWVRGHGNKREGWCGLCKPGRWLVLKNSAFWYDKSFTHGVSAATGMAFQGPTITRRTEGNSDVWEGLCGGCGEWVSLVSSKKKGTTWFRHAYKCHTHPKIKDGPKRRRETSTNLRTRATSAISSSFPILPAIATVHSYEQLQPEPSSNLAGLPSGPQPAGLHRAKGAVGASELPLSMEPVEQFTQFDRFSETRSSMPKSDLSRVKSDADNAADIKSPPKDTPLSTPQLSNTTLSTPIVETSGKPI